MLAFVLLSSSFCEGLQPPLAGGFRGSWRTSVGGRRFAAFQGIRYAQPPVGDLRFQDPVPIHDGNIQLAGEGPDCVQINFGNDDITGEEDCLFLNVYSHMDGRKLPVVVWIHGGAFAKGSGRYTLYGPQKLMDQDLIVVTINYRLGPLGFASLEEGSFPGNYGIRDQEMAVDWVLQNVHLFGGDPRRVTLAGHSAGAVAVLYLLNGPLSGKINRGIALSGTRYGPWALSERHRVRRNTRRLAKNLNCTREGETLDCLRKPDAKELLLTAKKSLYTWEKLLPYRPVVDGKAITSDPWVKDQPKNFSLLMGVTKQEAAFMSAFLGTMSESKKNTMFRLFLDEIAMVERMAGNRTNWVLKRLSGFYEREPDPEKRLVDVVSDSSFLFPAVVEAQSHRGQLHAFMFNFSSRLPFLLGAFPRSGDGVAHGDELPFLFDSQNCTLGGDAVYNRLSAKFTGAVARFVHGLNPGFTTYREHPELFDIREALLDVRRFRDIDEGIYKRLDFWMLLNARNEQHTQLCPHCI